MRLFRQKCNGQTDVQQHEMYALMGMASYQKKSKNLLSGIAE